MNNFFNQHNYNQFLYKNSLKKDLNKTGGFLVTLFVAMLVMSLAIDMLFDLPSVLNNIKNMTSAQITTFDLISNGLLSLSIFFLTGFIYCNAAKIRFAEILPFEKNKSSVLVPLCLMGLAIAMVANYASNAIISLFDVFNVDATVSIDYSFNSAIDIMLFYVTIALIPAFVEEFSFRGIVLGCLKKYSESFAIIVSSIMFGLMHGNFMQIPFAFIVGLILGYVTVKTNSILPAMIIHFLNNSVSVTISLLLLNESMPAYMIDVIYIIMMIFIAVAGILSTAFLIKKHKGVFKLSTADDGIIFKEKMKLFCKSPTMIIFAVFMLIEAIATLII